MAAEPADGQCPPDAASPALRLRTVLRGFTGFAIAVAGSLWLIFAVWLLANDAPSAEGEPFRFTPPPERTSVAATSTPVADGLR